MSVSSTISTVALKSMNPQEIRDDETWGIEEAMAKEFAIAQELQNSEAPSFNYLGFIKRRNDFLTITQYEEEVRNFDALAKEFDTAKLIKALGIAATTLIALHTRGIIHDDFMLANTAYDTRTDQARTIDLSFSRHAQRSDHSEFTRNVASYITSLGATESEYRTFRTAHELIEHHFIDIYAEAVSDIVPINKIDMIRKNVPHFIGTK